MLNWFVKGFMYIIFLCEFFFVIFFVNQKTLNKRKTALASIIFKRWTQKKEDKIPIVEKTLKVSDSVYPFMKHQCTCSPLVYNAWLWDPVFVFKKLFSFSFWAVMIHCDTEKTENLWQMTQRSKMMAEIKCLMPFSDSLHLKKKKSLECN